MNTLGSALRLTTFGESHGPAMGGILDGLPSQVKIDMEEVQAMLDRRRPGSDPLTSQRNESDIPEILSGISQDNLTLGTPIGFIFRNSDAKSKDYSLLENRFRPNHADYTYSMKYGIRDYRGGGRASARETVNWVMGGALTMQWLKSYNIKISAALTQAGKTGYEDPFFSCRVNPAHSNLPSDKAIEAAMREEIANAKRHGDSVGGRVSCIITGLPPGLGSPVFGKMQAKLANAMMSLNGVKGFEYGIGAEAAASSGSKTLDLFATGKELPFSTNFQGGILGGISSGMPVYFNLWFKPTPSIARQVPMPDINGSAEEILIPGRHDPCVALRAPVIVEALAALTIADLFLMR